MKKNNTARVLTLILSIFVIAALPKEAIRRTIYFFRASGFGVRQLEFYLQVGMTEFLICLLFAVMIIVFFVTLFKLIFSPAETKTDGLNQPRKETKTHAAHPGTSRSSQAGRAGAVKDGEDRYLAQLDSFLESGLVTGEEYQQLKERYKKSNRKG